MVRILVCAIAFVLLAGCTAYVDEPIEVDEMNPKSGQSIGWAQSGRLITFNQNSGVSMQKDFPVAGTYTVTFGIIAPPATIMRPKALISWKVKGSQVDREITISQGTSISGVATGVDVRAFDDMVTGLVGTPGIEYTLLVNCSLGVRPTNERPIFQPRVVEGPPGTFTPIAGAVTIPAGSTRRWAVPLGADSVRVDVNSSPLGTAIGNGDVTVQYFDPTGVIVYGSVFPGVPGQWLPLPSTVSIVQVSNNTGAVAMTALTMFGIDG